MSILLNPKQIPQLNQSKINGLVSALASKVDKITSANKLYGTDASAKQTSYNVADTTKVSDVKVNGSTVVTNKVANITVPTKLSDLTNDNYTTIGTSEINKVAWYDTEEEAKQASIADPTKLCFFPA